MSVIAVVKWNRVWVLFIVFLLLTGGIIKNASAWELEILQKKLKEKGARWKAGETSLTHLSTEEFRQMLGFKVYKEGFTPALSKKSKGSTPYSLPSSIDWRDYSGGNWVTPVKNQQLCGSCYAFATLGALETLIKLERGDPDFDIDLSEQHFVSCGSSGNRGGYDYGGCAGNYMDYSCDFLVSTGVPDEACFSYDGGQLTGSEPPCSNACSDVAERVYKISGYSFIASDGVGYIPSPEKIKSVVVNRPIICGFIVYGDFQNYAGGVYEPLPDQSALGGHMVIIVGYDDSQSCWIAKNSWGTEWGESGFCKIAYNQTSGSSMTFFGMDAVDLYYGDPETTSTVPPSSSTTTTTVNAESTTTTNVCPLEQIYGEYSEETELLRETRDTILSESPEGQEIIRLYYQWSPVIVKVMEEDEEFKGAISEMIDGVFGLIAEETN